MLNKEFVKKHIGPAGFILSILGIFTFGLTNLTAIIFCLIGIFKTKRKIFSIIGLLIGTFHSLIIYRMVEPRVHCVFSLALLSMVILVFCIINLYQKRHLYFSAFSLILSLIYIAFTLFFWSVITSSNCEASMKSEYKYRMLAKDAFWLDFDHEHMNKICYYGDIFGGFGTGKIYFKTDLPCLYEIDKIIAFAERNGWAYRGKAEFTKGNILDFFNCLDDPHKSENIKNEDTLSILFEWYNNKECKIRIIDSCIVLAFDTIHYAGFPSFVIIRDDSKEMFVRDYSKIFAPDTSDVLMLPEVFKDEENIWQDVHYY